MKLCNLEEVTRLSKALVDEEDKLDTLERYDFCSATLQFDRGETVSFSDYDWEPFVTAAKSVVEKRISGIVAALVELGVENPKEQS